MRGWILLVSLAVLAGCAKKEEKKVDNAATRYTSSLHQSLDKAQATADKANAAVAQTQAGIDRVQAETE